MRELTGVPNNMDILVRAFANVSGLGRALVREGRLQDINQLRAFATGFSNRQVFFDFVDVGPGKERADYKIQGKIYHSYLSSPPLLGLKFCSAHLFPHRPYSNIVLLSQRILSFSWKVLSTNISLSLAGTTLVMLRSWGSLLETSKLRNV